jgi:hypothetical protein
MADLEVKLSIAGPGARGEWIRAGPPRHPATPAAGEGLCAGILV